MFISAAHCYRWLLLPVTPSAAMQGRRSRPSLAASPAAAGTAGIWRHHIGQLRRQAEVAQLSEAAFRKQGSYFSHCRSVNFGQPLVTATQPLWSPGAPLTDSGGGQESPRAAAGGKGTVWQSWWCSCGHRNAPGASWGRLLSTAHSSHHWNLLSFPTQQRSCVCLWAPTGHGSRPGRAVRGLTGPYQQFNSRDNQTLALCWAY